MTLPTFKQVYHFKYRISYWTLFSWPRRLQVHAGTLDSTSDFALPPLDDDSQGFLLRSMPLPADTAGSPAGEPLLRYVVQRFPRYYIDMAGGDFEAYRSKFSGKTRSTLARKVRKFTEHGGGRLNWRQYRNPEEVQEFWHHARTVSAKTYQERLLDAGLPDTADYRRQAELWASDDALRAFLLFDGETPVAYLFCPIRDGIVDYAYLGYDPEYQRLSVGTVLQWLALESLFAEGRYRYFDFTEGETEHKRLFATGSMECAHVVLLRRSLLNRLLVHSHSGFNRGVEALRHWSERYDFKRRLQRWLRSGPAAT